MGAKFEHYVELAPDNHSFVYADHFESAKDLAEHLLYLDRNMKAYLDYFIWKENVFQRFNETVNNIRKVSLAKSLTLDQSLLCEVCSKLHDENYLNTKRNIVNIADTFNPKKIAQIKMRPILLASF